MNPNEIAAVYSQSSTRGSHPVGLVVKMYEAILEDFRRAIKAACSGDIEARTKSLNHALQVIAELQSVLDHQRGGDVSRRLDGFYAVTRTMITEANIGSNPEQLQKLIELYMPLRQAWKQVEEEADAGKLQVSDLGAKKTDSDGAEHSTERVSPDASGIHWNA